MGAEQSAAVVWYVLALVLVGSALLNQRLALRSGLGLVLIWIGIFAAAAGVYSQKAWLLAQFSRPIVTPAPTNGVKTPKGQGQRVTIAMSPDGHYWVDGEINGHSARFLVDSGATVTALSATTARDAGLNVDTAGPGVLIQTANGRTMARRSNIATLAIGPVQFGDVGVVASDAMGETNILGMNFLSRLRAWRVENGEMVLEQS